MNNQVAAECCGSCRECTEDLFCCLRLPYEHVRFWQIKCLYGDKYSPTNPISVIDLPGVKELVEKAFIAGLVEGVEAERGHIYAAITVGDAAKEYIKSLEDKDE